MDCSFYQPLTYFVLVISFLTQGIFCCEISGIAYTPYRVPDKCPSGEEVIEDVQFLFNHTRSIRIYSMDCLSVNRVLMEYASRGDISVMLGVWIDNVPQDEIEISTLLSLLAEYPYANLAGIAVGNEVAFRKSMTNAQLVKTVQRVRNEVRELAVLNSSRVLNEVPVFTIDIIPLRELAAVSDVLAVNIHPFYRRDLQHTRDPEVMANRILEATAMQIDFYRNIIPSKQILVTEIGWPTDSAPNDIGVGDLDVSFRFLQKFSAYAKRYGIEYYWFELFDSLWKTASFPEQPNSLSEFHWGIYEEDRKTMKYLPYRGC